MKKILKAFFFNSEGDFMPTYFWVTVLMTLVVTMIIMRLCSRANLSDMLILGVLGFVVGWCAVYNSGKKGNMLYKVREMLNKEEKSKEAKR